MTEVARVRAALLELKRQAEEWGCTFMPYLHGPIGVANVESDINALELVRAIEAVPRDPAWCKPFNAALCWAFLILAYALKSFDPTLAAFAVFGAGQCVGFAFGKGWA